MVLNKGRIKILLCINILAGLLMGCKANNEITQGKAADDNVKAVEVGENPSEKESMPGKEERGLYLLNPNPKTDKAWQDLADVYYKETGVSIKVVTAEDQYESMLQNELKTDSMPTIFTVAGPTMAEKLDEYLYDMKETSLYKHLIDKSLALENNGKVSAVASEYGCFGIIYNKKILSDYCSMEGAVVKSPENIKSLDTLLEVANDINNRKDEINDEFGYDLIGAFTSSGLDSSSSLRFSAQLASLPLFYEFKEEDCNVMTGKETLNGTYLDQFKTVWDMYISTSGADTGSLANGALNPQMEMGTYEAVFYQNGSWEFEDLINSEKDYYITEEELGMMPIYFGIDDKKQGLCIGSDSYWAINGKAKKENIDDAIAFLEWVITSDEGRKCLLEDMKVVAPYDTFTGEYSTSNPFYLEAEKCMQEGKTTIAWSYIATPNAEVWRNDLVKALLAYTDGSGDWSMVKSAFVDGWNNQWKLTHK